MEQFITVIARDGYEHFLNPRHIISAGLKDDKTFVFSMIDGHEFRGTIITNDTGRYACKKCKNDEVKPLPPSSTDGGV